MKANKGMTLGVALMVLGILATLALSLVGVSLHNLNVANRLGSLEQARNLAESSISLGIEQILKTREFGTERRQQDLLEVRPQDDDGSGRLTFFKGEASLAYSTNNLDGDASVPGFNGRSVPPHSIHLVGNGSFRGASRRVEAILTIPPYPYVISTAGSLQSTGNLLVAGLEEEQDLSTLSLDKLLPGNLLSNGTGPEALKLGPETRVTGDVRSAGGVIVDSRGTEILGEVKSYASPDAIPVMALGDYDPVKLGKQAVQFLRQDFLTSPVLQGYVRRSGNCRVHNGLVLDNAVLFVDGDLEVHGGVRGMGAIFVTGKTTIAGGASFSTDNEAAVISGGALTLTGSGSSTASFRGLLYAGGDFRAQGMTLIGSLIVHGNTAILDNAKLAYVSSLTKVDVPMPGAFTLLRLGSDDSANHQNSNEHAQLHYPIPVRFDNPTYTVQNPLNYALLSGLTQDEAMQRIAEIIDQMGGAAAVNPNRIRTELRTLEQQAAENGSGEIFRVDPSRFLRFEDRIRIALWGEL